MDQPQIELHKNYDEQSDKSLSHINSRSVRRQPLAPFENSKVPKTTTANKK